MSCVSNAMSEGTLMSHRGISSAAAWWVKSQNSNSPGLYRQLEEQHMPGVQQKA